MSRTHGSGHGSCRGSWNISGCWDMNPETWILQRIREIERCWDMNPKTWILWRILRYIWLLRYGSGDMDLAEVPEIHMDAEIWIRRHGSCRGSWDTHGCWDMNAKTWIGHMDLAEDPEIRRCWNMNPKTWILSRILRCKVAETWAWDMDLAEDPEI